MTIDFRVVADTNVILSSQKGKPTSPAVELIDRWMRAEFDLYYSDDIFSEYIVKMVEIGISRQRISVFIAALRQVGIFIEVNYYHERYYPADPDDVAFLICATNGNATHLVSYDRHLLDLAHRYAFTICRPIPFLDELRESQSG